MCLFIENKNSKGFNKISCLKLFWLSRIEFQREFKL
jgi:hypothetical protein